MFAAFRELLHDAFVRDLIAGIGWTLLHFCWQGLAIALLAWAAMTLLRSPRLRYAIGCVAMLATVLAPAVTLALHWPEARVVLLAPKSPAFVLPHEAILLEPSAGKPLTIPPPPVRTWSDLVATASPAIVTGWTAGVALLLVYRLLGLASIARLRRYAVPIEDELWQQRLRRLSAAMGVRRSIALLRSTRIECPAVLGVWRPAILWPAAAMTGLTPTQVEALLAHELAHIRRHDFIVNLVQTLIETLLFYHPAVWWLSARVRLEREHCCDDLAAQAVGGRAVVADALAAMEIHRQQVLVTSSMVLSSNGGSLVQRVRRLLAPSTTPARRPARRFRSPLSLRSAVLTLGSIAATFAVVIWTAHAAPSDTPASQPVSNRTLPALTDAQREAADRDAELLTLVRRYDSDVALFGVAERSDPRLNEGSLERVRPELRRLHDAIVARATQMGAHEPQQRLSDADRAAASPIGEYYMGGHVTRPGVYSVSNRTISLKQAVIAAGWLSGGDRPKNADGTPVPDADVLVDVVRRIEGAGGVRMELTARFRWGDVLSGAQPDVTMLPDDQVVVGVNAQPSTTPANEHARSDAPNEPTLSAGDLVIVQINELAGPGLQQVEQHRISEDGKLTLPYMNGIAIAGMTPTDAARTIQAAYAGRNAKITVGVTRAEAPAATRPAAQDYRLAANDLLQVQIWDLAGAGQESVLLKRVPASGRITLPYLPNGVVVGGLSEAEAEAAIHKAYNDARVIQNAQLSVLAIERSDGVNVRSGAAGRGLGNERITGNQAATEGDRLTADGPVQLENAAPTPTTRQAARTTDPVLWPRVLELAKFEPVLQQLLQDHEAILRELERAQHRYGPNAPAVRAMREQLTSLQERIMQIAHTLNAAYASQATTTASETESPLARYRRLQVQRQEIVDALAQAEVGDANDTTIAALKGLLQKADQSIDELVGQRGTFEVTTDAHPERLMPYSLPAARVVTLRDAVQPYRGSGYDTVVVRRWNGQQPGGEYVDVARFTWADATGSAGAAFEIKPDDRIVLSPFPTSQPTH